MIDSDYDDLFDRVRGNLGEHFTNYRVGRMLVKETQLDMDQEIDSVEIVWDTEEEEESEEDG
jgi:hypothetical protein